MAGDLVAPPTDDDMRAAAADLAAGTITPQFEGYSATPYWDPDGKVWTTGYGSTRIGGTGAPVTQFTPAIDEPTARAWAAAELTAALRTIKADVRVPLTVHETAALADFIYNVGAGNFGSSTLLHLLNAGDYEGAAAQFARWNVAGGKVLAGLIRRRAAEKALFDTPDAPG